LSNRYSAKLDRSAVDKRHRSNLDEPPTLDVVRLPWSKQKSARSTAISETRSNPVYCRVIV